MWSEMLMYACCSQPLSKDMRVWTVFLDCHTVCQQQQTPCLSHHSPLHCSAGMDIWKGVKCVWGVHLCVWSVCVCVCVHARTHSVYVCVCVVRACVCMCAHVFYIRLLMWWRIRMCLFSCVLLCFSFDWVYYSLLSILLYYLVTLGRYVIFLWVMIITYIAVILIRWQCNGLIPNCNCLFCRPQQKSMPSSHMITFLYSVGE